MIDGVRAVGGLWVRCPAPFHLADSSHLEFPADGSPPQLPGYFATRLPQVRSGRIRRSGARRPEQHAADGFGRIDRGGDREGEELHPDLAGWRTDPLRDVRSEARVAERGAWGVRPDQHEGAGTVLFRAHG